jgi:hypothetical protein
MPEGILRVASILPCARLLAHSGNCETTRAR